MLHSRLLVGVGAFILCVVLGSSLLCSGRLYFAAPGGIFIFAFPSGIFILFTAYRALSHDWGICISHFGGAFILSTVLGALCRA